MSDYCQTANQLSEIDVRAELLALIAAYDEHGGRWWVADVDALYQAVQRARAALDGPDVPEGREPAAVEGQPSDEELLCIAAEAIDGYGDGIKPGEYESSTESAVEAYGSELCAFARAVLARWGNQQSRPIPVQAVEALAARPLLERVAALGDCIGEQTVGQVRALADRAAFLLEQLSAFHPQRPIPVSERLPEPGDCDEHGRCWLWAKVGGDWRLIDPVNSGLPRLHYGFSHWLPANALPLPEDQS